jgi:TRAP-type C4-dicarboxylate transport system substrate-binding protein
MLKAAACVVAVAVALAACGGHDKAGGSDGRGGTRIEIVTRDGSPAYMDAYVAAVERLAPGTTVKVRSGYRNDEVDPEGATVADVGSGRVPFAFVSARVFDDLGVDAFAPFVAPLAIDSLDAQRRVLASGLADKSLPALDELKVVGVAVLPGALRHPVGLTRPLLRPDDYRGARIGVRRSAMARRAVEQLGATADTKYAEDVTGFDGVEADLIGIESGRWDVGAVTLAVNVTLWPRIQVLIANPKAWDALAKPRRDALHEAARASLPATTADLARTDDDAYDVLCRRSAGMLVRATAGDVAALRTALAPISATLDPATTRAIARLRAQALPSPPRPACRPAAGVRQRAATPVDGAWEFESDEADLRAAPGSQADITPENYGHYVFAFSHGRWAYNQKAPGACTWAYGTYAVHGHRMIWDVTDGGGSGPQNAVNQPGEHFEYVWSAFKDTLEVEPVRGAVSPSNFIALPWRRVGADPLRAPFVRECLPPAAGLQF